MMMSTRNYSSAVRLARAVKVVFWFAAACILFTYLLLTLSSVLLFLILLPLTDHASTVLFNPFPESAWARTCGFLFYFAFTIDSRFVLANVAPPMYAMAMTLYLALRRGVGWLKGKAAAMHASTATAPGHRPDPGVEAQLVAVIHILLSHLPPAELRSLWQVSKQLALEVWRCSPAVRLSLTNTNPIRRWTMRLAPCSLLRSSPNPLAQLINSKRPSFLPAAAMSQGVQSISLSSMQLDASSFESLRTLLPNLKHLSLVTCHIKSAPNTRPAQAVRSHASTGATRQALLSLSSFSGWESKAAALVDCRHLQSLGTDDPGIFSMLEPRHFPALRVLRLTSGVVSDAQLDALLGAKPQMQEVWLPQLELRRDHSAQACSWGLLRLQGNPLGENPSAPKYAGLHALELALLPLENIRRLVVERELYAWSNGVAADLALHGCVWSTAWPRLCEAAERLEFEPGISGWSHLWAWSTYRMSQVDLGLDDDEPGFALHLTGPSSGYLSIPPEARMLAAIVACRMQGGTFVYSGCDLADPAAVDAALLPLQSLSSAVHSLVLRGRDCMLGDPCELLDRLPLHVERLVVKRELDEADLHPRLMRDEYRREQRSMGAKQPALAAAHR